MIESARYTLKVWLTSICISPVILQVIYQINSSKNAGATFGQAMFMWCFITAISFCCSLLTWILFFTCTYQLLKFDLPHRYYKAFVQASGLLLVLLTFYCLKGFIGLLDYPFRTFTSCYLLTIGVCMQLYAIPQFLSTQHQTT